MSLFTQTKTKPKSLTPGGPNTNDVFEQIRQNPISDYSVSVVYLVAMMAAAEEPMKGDHILYNASECAWTVYRNAPGFSERKITLQLVQVTHGGSLQFRVLDIAANRGWRSVYLPTGPLSKSAKRQV